MRALAQHVWGEGDYNCLRCPHDSSLSNLWGCDGAPAPRAVFSVVCCACGGTGIGCDCRGGQRDFFHCPKRLLRYHQDLEHVFRLYQNYDAHGVLPYEGGLAQQAASLVEAFATIEVERSAIQREKAERAEREQKRAEFSRKLEERKRRGR